MRLRAFVLSGLLLLASASLMLHAQSATNQTDPDPVEPLEIELPLFHRGVLIGSVPARVDLTVQSLIAVHRSVSAEIAELVIPQRQTALSAIETEWVSAADLEPLGIVLSLDMERIGVALNLSRDAERPTQHSLSARQPPDPRTLTAGARFTSFLNLYATVEHQLRASDINNEEIWARRLGIDLAASGGRVSALVAGRVASDSDPAFDLERDLERAVLRADWPKSRVRAEAGTLSVPTSGLLGAQSLVGAAVLRDFSLDPFFATSSSGEVSIYLETPSEVTILVNGRVVQRLSLPAGPVILSDYPLAAGLNRVELEITDQLGRVETVTVAMPYSTQLLRHRTSSFLAGGGAYRSDLELGIATLSGRYGIHPALTLGAGTQLDNDEGLAAIDTALATPIGNFRADLGLHLRGEDGLLSFAGNAEYSFALAAARMAPRVAAGGRLREAGFRAPQPTPPSDSIEAARVYSSVAQPLGRRASLSLTATRSWNRAPVSDLTSVGFLLSALVRRGGTLTARTRFDVSDDGSGDFIGAITYIQSFYGGRLSAGAGYDLAEETVSAQARGRFNPSASQTVALGAAVDGLSQDGSKPWNANASLRYDAPLVEASLSHVISHSPQTDFSSYATTARAAGALVMADGTYSLSRPIRDSFVIIERHPRFSDVDIEVRSDRSSGVYPVYFWGTGVVPNLRAYQLHSITVDAPFLPDGYDLGPSVYRLQPGHLQATVIQVGTDATVYVQGTLVDDQGRPVALTAATLLDAEERETLFFSDWSGIFVAYGLRRGEYRVVLPDGRSGGFSVPESAEGELEIGAVQME